MAATLLTNCHVIPCDGRPPIQDGAVLIEGTTIRDLVAEKQRLDETQSLMAGI